MSHTYCKRMGLLWCERKVCWHGFGVTCPLNKKNSVYLSRTVLETCRIFDTLKLLGLTTAWPRPNNFMLHFPSICFHVYISYLHFDQCWHLPSELFFSSVISVYFSITTKCIIYLTVQCTIINARILKDRPGSILGHDLLNRKQGKRFIHKKKHIVVGFIIILFFCTSI